MFDGRAEDSRLRIAQQAQLVAALFGELREGELAEFVASGRLPGSEPVVEPPPSPAVQAAIAKIKLNGGRLIVGGKSDGRPG